MKLWKVKVTLLFSPPFWASQRRCMFCFFEVMSPLWAWKQFRPGLSLQVVISLEFTPKRTQQSGPTCSSMSYRAEF